MNMSEMGVSYYEIGGAIQTSRVSSISTVTSLSGAEKRISPTSVEPDDVRGVCYAPAEQGSRHVPYTMGNPLINLGFNILLRGIEEAGLDPFDEPRLD